jgi:hypothetical protein
MDASGFGVSSVLAQVQIVKEQEIGVVVFIHQ